jgi:hypothetical protein
VRKQCEYLPEYALRTRKAFFTQAETGFLNRDVAAPSMNMMGNPDMMDGMLK